MLRFCTRQCYEKSFSTFFGTYACIYSSVLLIILTEESFVDNESVKTSNRKLGTQKKKHGNIRATEQCGAFDDFIVPNDKAGSEVS